MIGYIKDVIGRMLFLIEDRQEERSRENHPDHILDAIEQKVWEVPETIASHGEYQYSIDVRYPGPYFLVYTSQRKIQQPYLHYCFSYRPAKLTWRQFLLRLRGTRSILSQVNPDRPIPYYGSDPRLRRHTRLITKSSTNMNE